jgi:quercetin dioxygenase-like cupin family protein
MSGGGCYEGAGREDSDMARILEHPSTGDRIIVHTSTAESAGMLFRFEYVTCTPTPPAPDHVHPTQEERVEVLAGTVHCRIAGRERVLGVGERVVIPPGVPHAVWSEDATESRAIGEFRPALHTEAMFAALFAAA